MSTTTFSGPIKSGTIKHTTGTTVGSDIKNTGFMVCSQSATLNYSDGADVDLFVIPANSQIIDFYVDITTAFDAGTTNTIDIGKTGTDNYFADNLAAGTAARVLGSSDASQLANYKDVGATDIYVQASYDQTGTAATAGVAEITCVYVQGNNLTA